MSILNVEHLSHGFGDRAIFDDVSFRLLKGEHIGLIGANGEGKSTFMNIITGKLEPDAGKVEWNKRVRVGYLDQHTSLDKNSTVRDVLKTAFAYLYDLENEMNDYYMKMGDASEQEINQMLEEVGNIQEILEHNDFYIIDTKIEEASRGMGINEIGLDKKVDDLSGGQRTKILLTKLLLEKPDILLLDEPTNYLDAEHINYLTRYLQNYENAFILISHDIPFLTSVINLIYNMENLKLDRYSCTYDEFLKIRQARKEQIESAYKRQQQEIADLKDFVQRNKARIATRNMAMSRQKKLDKMEIIELEQEKPKPEFEFKSARTSGRVIFETKDLVIGYDKPLSKPINFKLERNQKIAITGANGLGKTTLVKSLLGHLKPISGFVIRGEFLEIGYFEQEIKEANHNTCIEEVWNEFPSLDQREVRAMLAKCGLTTKHIESKIMVLSGGEQAKVRLCKLMNRPTNVLILDEPTNHLDIYAKDELKRVLKEYKGTILLICHEEDFYQDFVDHIVDCRQWSLLA